MKADLCAYCGTPNSIDLGKIALDRELPLAFHENCAVIFDFEGSRGAYKRAYMDSIAPVLRRGPTLCPNCGYRGITTISDRPDGVCTYDCPQCYCLIQFAKDDVDQSNAQLITENQTIQPSSFNDSAMGGDYYLQDPMYHPLNRPTASRSKVALDWKMKDEYRSIKSSRKTAAYWIETYESDLNATVYEAAFGIDRNPAGPDDDSIIVVVGRVYDFDDDDGYFCDIMDEDAIDMAWSSDCSSIEDGKRKVEDWAHAQGYDSFEKNSSIKCSNSKSAAVWNEVDRGYSDEILFSAKFPTDELDLLDHPVWMYGYVAGNEDLDGNVVWTWGVYDEMDHPLSRDDFRCSSSADGKQKVEDWVARNNNALFASRKTSVTWVEDSNALLNILTANDLYDASGTKLFGYINYTFEDMCEWSVVKRNLDDYETIAFNYCSGLAQAKREVEDWVAHHLSKSVMQSTNTLAHRRPSEVSRITPKPLKRNSGRITRTNRSGAYNGLQRESSRNKLAQDWNWTRNAGGWVASDAKYHLWVASKASDSGFFECGVEDNHYATIWNGFARSIEDAKRKAEQAVESYGYLAKRAMPTLPEDGSCPDCGYPDLQGDDYPGEYGDFMVTCPRCHWTGKDQEYDLMPMGTFAKQSSQARLGTPCYRCYADDPIVRKYANSTSNMWECIQCGAPYTNFDISKQYS